MKRGLLPKIPRKIGGAVQRNYEPRIYLTLTKQDALEMMTNFNFMGDEKKYVILVVYTALLKPGTKFYQDVDGGTGTVWTRTPIPASAIHVIE